MLKLNAGIARKVGEPAYGSRGANVNLELEVESELIHDPDGLTDRIRRLFALARQAVDEELDRGGTTAPRTNGHTAGPKSGNGHNGRNGERPATASQLRAIRAIAERLGLDAETVTHDATGITLAELSLRQASTLIDQLKARDGQSTRR